MESYLDTLTESIQRSPEEKRKAKAIQKELEEAFGDKIYSKKFDYDLKIDDLEVLFAIANKNLFKNKLERDKVKISIFEHSKKEKGSFKIGLDKDSKHELSIVKYSKDNFFQIVNVFLHELIHFYDVSYGPLSKPSDTIKIIKLNGREYVGNYYAHGRYFKDWCDKINKFGFCIKEKYSIDDKRIMKKITEKKRNTDSFFDKKKEIDDTQYKRVKRFYDSLKGCNKDMVYRDAEHWYVEIY